MLRNLSICGVLGMFSFAESSLESARRSKLIDLLQSVDNIDNGNSLTYMSSFLETEVRRGQYTSGGGGGPVEQRRRVKSHEPCECPDYMDTMEASCLSRRHTMLGKALTDLTGSADAPENMRAALRDSFWMMFNRSEKVLESIDSMHVDIFNGTKSRQAYLSQATDYASNIKRATRVFIQLMDFMWSQQFIIVELTRNDTERISDLYHTAVGKWANFFNDIQRQQEVISFSNYKLVASYLQHFLSKNADLMNIPTGEVHRALKSLSDSMEFNEDGTVKLRDTLLESSSDMSVQFNEATDYVSETFTDRARDFPEKVASKITSPFIANGAELVSQFKSSTGNKILQFQTSTGHIIESNQPSPYIAKMRSQQFAEIRDALKSVVDNHDSGRTDAVSMSQEGIKSVVGHVTALGQAVSQSVSEQNTALRAEQNQISELTTNLNGNTVTTEKRLVSNSTSNSQGLEQNANNLINTMFISANSSAGRIVNQAAGAVGPVVDSVGVEARTSDLSMRSTINDMTSNLAAQTHGFSMDSNSVSSAIWKQMLMASGLIDSSSANIVNDISAKASAVFGSVSDDLWADPVSARKYLDLILGAMADRQSSGASETITAGNQFQAQHMKLASDLESNIGSIIALIAKSAMSSDEKMQLIRRLLHSHSSVQEDDKSIRNGMSDSANQIGGMSEQMAFMLSQAFGKALGSNAESLARGVSPAMVRYLVENSGRLAEVDSQLKNVDGSVSESGNDFQDALSDHKATLSRLLESYNLLQSSTDNELGYVSVTSRQMNAKGIERVSSLAALSSGEHLIRLQQERLGLSEGIHQSAFDALTRARGLVSNQADQNKKILAYVGNQERRAAKKSAERKRMSDRLATLALQYAQGLDTIARHSDLPISSRDVTTLSGEVFARSSAATSDFESIGVKSNVTANSMLQSMASLIQRYVDMYKEEEARAEETLDKVSAAMTNQSRTSGNANLLGDLARAVGYTIGVTNTVPLDTHLPAITMDIPGSILQNQTRVAQVESSAVSNLNQRMLVLNHSLISQLNATLDDQILEANRAGAVTGLKTQIGSNVISKTLADNQKLAEDTREMMKDYHDNLQAKMGLMRSSPKNLLNQVAETKSHMARAMGRLSATLAQSMSDSGANGTSETGAAALLANHQLTALKKMFVAFSSYASKEKFDLYIEQLNDFLMHTVGMKMIRGLNSGQKKVTAKSDRINRLREQLLSEVSDMQLEYKSLESQEAHLAESVDDWSSQQGERLVKLNSSIASLESQIRHKSDTTQLIQSAIRNMTSLISETFPEYPLISGLNGIVNASSV